MFQKDIIVQVLLVMAVLLLLWTPALIAPQPIVEGEHPAILYGILCHWLASVPRLTVVIAMILLLAEGLLLNVLLSNVNLVSQNSLLPTLLYILAASAGTATLTPVLLVNGIVIAALNHLMLRGTLLTIPPEKICAATMLIGVATLFYQPAVLLLLSYLLVAANYRLYNWKDWMLMVFGFAAPYVLLLSILYFTDGMTAWWQTTLDSLADIGLHIGATGTIATICTLVLSLAFLVSLLGVAGHLSEHPVLWQKNASTVMLLTLAGVVMLPYTHLIAMALFAIPFTFTAYHLLTPSRTAGLAISPRRRRLSTWPYDLLLVLLIVASFLC